MTIRIERYEQQRVTRLTLDRSPADDALDLARLVRSAAAPGLRERIRAYRVAATAKRAAGK